MDDWYSEDLGDWSDAGDIGYDSGPSIWEQADPNVGVSQELLGRQIVTQTQGDYQEALGRQIVADSQNSYRWSQLGNVLNSGLGLVRTLTTPGSAGRPTQDFSGRPAISSGGRLGVAGQPAAGINMNLALLAVAALIGVALAVRA